MKMKPLQCIYMYTIHTVQHIKQVEFDERDRAGEKEYFVNLHEIQLLIY